MKLPKTNPNEELEQLSKDKLRPLLNIARFEIREEVYRDKGIDLNVELKYKGQYTGYRFLIQLKSSESLNANKDGSYSLSIDTANINYLLNSTLPSVYILYLTKEDIFLYSYVNEFYKYLEESTTNWQEQDTNTLRFSKELDEKAISELFQEIYNKGIFQRSLNEKLAMRTSLIETEQITINKNLSVTDDAEIRLQLENYGFELINKTEWKLVLKIFQKASHNITISSRLALVVGVAYYYTGKYYEAIKYFNIARNAQPIIRENAANYLHYIDTIAKYALGFISRENYESIQKSITNDSLIGMYIQLEDAKQTYFNATNDPKRYSSYLEKINQLIKKANSHNNFRLNLLCDKLFVEGMEFVQSYWQNICRINALELQQEPVLEMRIEFAKTLMGNLDYLMESVTKLEKEALKASNLFVYSLCHCQYITVMYDFLCVTDIFRLELELEGYDIPKFNVYEKLPHYLENISIGISNFRSFNHFENTIFALSLKYQILHFMKQYGEAEATLLEIKQLAEPSGISEIIRKFEYLKDGGTKHEEYQKLYIEKIELPRKKMENWQRRHEELVHQMKKMDDFEKEQTKKDIECEITNYQVELFPIGYFYFPKYKIQEFFEIMNIYNQNLKQELVFMFEYSLVARLNILYENIEKEGYREGHEAYKTIDNYEYVFTRRKAMFDKKFYRLIF